MLQKLVSHSPDLSQLCADGYDIIVGPSNHLLTRDVPYLNSAKQVKRGIIVCDLDVAGDATVPPKTHVAFFVGDYPCGIDGAPLPGVSVNANQALGEGLRPNHQMSRKPTIDGSYRDFYHKIATYCEIVASPAQTVDPTVTPRTYPVVVPTNGESPFNYLDTAATKAGIVVANSKLEAEKVAIIGLGGTGSYVLDLVAKTPVQEIHLFDHDGFLNHNAFRCPGAASLDDLVQKFQKVHYLSGMYSRMRKYIVPHDCYLDSANVDLLNGISFVFICIDKGACKRPVIEWLQAAGILFIDVGMGVQLGDDNSLAGILTVTTSTSNKHDHVASRIALSDGVGENEYSRNVHIADLNALNAALAVIKWKKVRGYYRDLGKEHSSAYTIDVNEITNGDTL